MIIAVLEKRTGLKLMSSDVYVNVAGGIRPEGTSIDLAVATAICSAALGRPMSDPQTIVLGEIGLTGELRGVSQPERIASEAARMGFHKILMPEKNRIRWSGPKNIEIIGAKDLREAVNKVLQH